MSKYEDYRTDFTVEDISGFLSVSKETVRRWIRNGDLVALNKGAKKEGYDISRTDFLRFLRKNEKYRNVFYRGGKDESDKFANYMTLDTTNSVYWDNVPSSKVYIFPNGTRVSVFKHSNQWSFVASYFDDEDVEQLLETVSKIDGYGKGGINEYRKGGTK